ncbi:transposase [Tahibacter amnicola]|uniref:Transposase n=1 Tax=Tahibacter amnicola TaxID=2976241 RepID=A0ABY6BDM9_9GAMM|nr:transposase [Tahibacter amnicola]UXI68133.1 transposase [Tahibacter amnicola]
MRQPRYQLVSTSERRFYHCVSRCVRRAYLCGFDTATGQSFEHRRQWVEERLLALADIFAVGIYAYAVMENHVHLVLMVDPAVAATWSAETVAERWVRLCPVRTNGKIDADACRMRQDLIASDPVQTAVYRHRLVDLAWFMRSLNEPIARRANSEDACTGHFWESRYKCQALLDDAAIVACMTYVDLNPVRAGIASDLASSTHTSVTRRLRSARPAGHALRPIRGIPAKSFPITTIAYIDLVEWTGRQYQPGKRGRISEAPPSALRQLAIDEVQWRRQAMAVESCYWRAVGSMQRLIDKAHAIGQSWLKGTGRVAQAKRC